MMIGHGRRNAQFDKMSMDAAVADTTAMPASIGSAISSAAK